MLGGPSQKIPGSKPQSLRRLWELAVIFWLNNRYAIYIYNIFVYNLLICHMQHMDANGLFIHYLLASFCKCWQSHTKEGEAGLVVQNFFTISRRKDGLHGAVLTSNR